MQEQIIYKKVSELKNNPNNPRKNDNAVDYKRKSLRTECKTASFFYKK